MKTSRTLLLTAGALLFTALPSHADELSDLLNPPADSSGRSHHSGRSAAPAKGLQLASGLQPSGPLNGSGAAPIAVRLTEDEWRKFFPRKDAAK